MTCPRCGTYCDDWPCPECGFPAVMKRKDMLSIMLKNRERSLTFLRCSDAGDA